MKLEFKEKLCNQDGAIRYTFRDLVKSDYYLVIKFFDPKQLEKFTFKIFCGSYDSVKKYWTTMKNDELTEADKNRLNQLSHTLKLFNITLNYP